MKKTLVILGFISSIIALILAFTPLFSIAIIPGVLAIILGVIIFILSKKNSKKVSVYILVISLIALALSTYKIIFVTAEVGNIEDLQQKEKASENDAKELLEGIEIE